jgi:hypothetical protein
MRIWRDHHLKQFPPILVGYGSNTKPVASKLDASTLRLPLPHMGRHGAVVSGAAALILLVKACYQNNPFQCYLGDLWSKIPPPLSSSFKTLDWRSFFWVVRFCHASRFTVSFKVQNDISPRGSKGICKRDKVYKNACSTKDEVLKNVQVFMGKYFQFPGVLERGQPLTQTMLKWTCRLRDLFESKGYQTFTWSLKQCTEIREAEFVGGSFPEEFRWETFMECSNYESRTVASIFSRTSVSNIDHLVPAIDLNSEVAKQIRSMHGRSICRLRPRNIDVWWISPTLFISWMEIFLDKARLEDFQVTFLEGGSGWEFHVYSLSAFGSERQFPSWLLPIDFCRHLIALLPANYFRALVLRCSPVCKSVPLDYFLHFLSIIPYDAPQPPPCRMNWTPLGMDEPWTRFHLYLGRKINQDELRSIFSHQFHPAVMMSFYCSVFDESVSMDAFCNLLREARHLRAVGLPDCLIQNDNNPNLSFEKIRCKAAVLTSFLPRGSYSSAFLLSYSKFHEATDIHMDFSEWMSASDMHRMGLRSFIGPFFQMESTLERLSLRFRDSNWRMQMQWVLGAIPACTSKDLCFFNVEVKAWDKYRNLDHIEPWDQGLFPTLTLNYCRKNITKPVEALSLAIKAVNQGVIYRKTTDHLPSNTKTTNAGVIFYLLKARTDSLVSWVLAHVILPLRRQLTTPLPHFPFSAYASW